jgi:phosphoenolpyruvate carboxylase
MQALADRSPDQSEHRSDEPYRKALVGHVREAGGHAEGADAAPRRCATRSRRSRRTPAPTGFLADLRTIEDSLRRHHGGALIAHRLAPLIRAVAGVRLPPGRPWTCARARTGTRRVVAELLRVARVEPDYAALPEDARRTLLLSLLDDARPLRVRGAGYSGSRRGELAIFDLAATLLARYGRRRSATTSSRTPRTSPTCSRCCCCRRRRPAARHAGRRRDRRPDRGAAVRDDRGPAQRGADHASSNALPGCARHDACARRRAGRECSATATATRTAAFFTSNWELYRAEVRVLELFAPLRDAHGCTLRLFHGRGGTSGGAAPSHRRSSRSRRAR